jgi:hypothetical protein
LLAQRRPGGGCSSCGLVVLQRTVSQEASARAAWPVQLCVQGVLRGRGLRVDCTDM